MEPSFLFSNTKHRRNLSSADEISEAEPSQERDTVRQWCSPHSCRDAGGDRSGSC